MAKFCRYCGSPVREDARFCRSCGKPLAKAAAPAREGRPAYTPTRTAGTGAGPSPAPTQPRSGAGEPARGFSLRASAAAGEIDLGVFDFHPM